MKRTPPPTPRFIFLILFLIVAADTLAQIKITFTTSDYNGYNISCFGKRDGSITATVTGGTPPYTYMWSNSQTTQTISGLRSDYFSVLVTDSTYTLSQDGINLTSPDMMNPYLVAYQYNNGYNISLNGASNGMITTFIDGGVEPYSYQWEDEATTQNRSMLGGGYYTLVVSDANNCFAEVSTTLSEPVRDDWTMDGNSNTNPAENYIGTADNKDLVFKTNEVERLRIGKSGTIIMPQTTHFETVFTDRINTTSADSTIHIGDSSIVINPFFGNIFNDGLGYFYKGIGLGGVNSNFNNIGSAVGIAKNSVAIGNSVTGWAENAIVIGSGPTNDILINSTPNSLFIGFNSDLPTLVVKPASGSGTTGEVGIGTADVPTGYKLAVHGKILCEEVKVLSYTSWDEVFSHGYAMLTPKQLKEFIFLNHHLPHIPSYKEMQKAEGISVGDFQMRILRTVEEQAVYITKMDERMDKLEAENKALREQIKSVGNH